MIRWKRAGLVSRLGLFVSVAAVSMAPIFTFGDPPPRTIHGQDSSGDTEGAAPATDGKKLFLQEELRLVNRRGASQVLFSPDGKFLLRLSNLELSLWDLSGTDPKELPATMARSLDMREITAAAFSPDGTMLALGGGDNSVRLFSFDPSGTLTQLSSQTEHDKPVLSLQFNPKGNLLASGGDDQAVFLWTVAKGQLNQVGIIKIERAVFGVKHIAFMPHQNSMLITVGDGTVCGLDFSNDRITTQSVTKLPAIFNLPMAISPNGNQIVFGSKEDVRIWDRQSKNAYHLHSGNISGVAWSADGRVFASVGEDGRLVVWTPGGKVRYEMLRPSKFASVAFSPIDPKGGTLQLACANDNGTIYLIRLGDAPVAAPPANADKPTGIPTSYSPGKLWQALTGRI